MEGFFSLSSLTKPKDKSKGPARCGTCGLYKTCYTPKMKAAGYGKKRILIVRDAPTIKADEFNEYYRGEVGTFLKQTFIGLGINTERDCINTYALLCHPKNNSAVTNERISCCRPNLLRTIKKFKPTCIILMAGSAVQSLIGYIQDEESAKGGAYIGYQIPDRKFNTWICPVLHPVTVMKSKGRICKRAFRKQIRAAVKKATARPYAEDIISYEDSVELITRPTQAAKLIKQITGCGGTMSFDYETNALKPEYIGSQIYSCSICFNGKRTFAFPWADSVVEPMKDLLRSPIKKIAANLKFEHRWSVNKLKVKPRAWLHDTMLCAHVLDNKRGVTSLDFQAFVHLGQCKYSSHIKPYLSSDNPTHLNRIQEIGMNDLLLYNGMDSILEYKLAKIQMKLMGE